MLLAEPPAKVCSRAPCFRLPASLQTSVTNCFVFAAFQLINHTVNNFHISADKVAVARIAESLSTLQQARELRMRESENALKSE
jgi:hypothetical protein